VGTKKKPRLLDLCCKAGGCSMGYARAGFEVVGVDLEPQPSYPFEFHQADALTFSLDKFDVIHASPPCPGYSAATSFHRQARKKHPLLIPAFRERLEASGKFYIIENVERARSYMKFPILLCGEMFGLRTYRHRLFESNIELYAPEHPEHVMPVVGPGAIARAGEYWSVGGHFGQKDRAQREALGIDWMDNQEDIANAIPPVYTEWLGLQLLQALSTRRGSIRVQLCECGCRQIARSATNGGRPGKYATDVCRVRVNRAKKAYVTKLVTSGTERLAV
jgi:DNA (cytosine-5)-methyltransferase 1